MQSIFKNFKYFLFPYIVFVLFCLICLVIFSKSYLFFIINENHNQFFDFVFYITNNLGDGWCFGILLISVFFFLQRKLFFLGIIIFTSSTLVSIIFKWLIFKDSLRPRSWFKNSEIIHFVDGVTVYTNHSFPSGHTITAFSLAIYCTYVVKNKKYGLLFLFLAIMAGYSRIYLGQHFFGDVTFGSIISVITSLTCVFYYERYFGKDDLFVKV